MASYFALNETTIEEEEKEFLTKFIKYGFSLFFSTFDDIKTGKRESGSFAGNAVGVAAGGLAATATMFFGGGAGASATGSKVKSMSDTAFNHFDSEKYEKERKNILSWTNSVGKDNEKQFLSTIAQGLAYICVAFKDQINMFHQNDANNETFFNDVFRRVFNHMKENPRNGSSFLTPEEFFNAFIKGRSTPQGLTNQVGSLVKNFSKGRGMYLTGKEGQELNTQELIENPGHIVPKEKPKFSLFVHKLKKGDSFQIKDFRLKYEFEDTISKQYLNIHDYQTIYSKLEDDWRLNTQEVQCYIKIISKRVGTKEIFDFNWFPERKTLPIAFYERSENDFYLERLQSAFSKNSAKKKLTLVGGGGVGKSATAIWFALKCEHNYDHVIWLDCGIGSVEESFRRLAHFIKLEDRKELVLNDLARGCFQSLKHYDCLWIYDNAEHYICNEGIKNVLPDSSYASFHVMITSRNQEWGTSTGLGAIPHLSIDIFNEVQATEFLAKNIDDFLQKHDGKTELSQLSHLLGYLSLGLQIAIATINQHKISVHDYSIRIKKTDGLIETDFENYENNCNINKTMSVSLDLIKSIKTSSGSLANNILKTFGYIRADNVSIEFFSILEDVNIEKIKEAAELIEKYSLVTFSRRENSLSVHRLLQQVIRYNDDSRNDTIRKILACEGFTEYKLIPYCFADENLQKEFPEINPELGDSSALQNLLIERRFEEAVELSRLIKEYQGIEFLSLSYLYNYAYCLKRNKENTEAQEIFERLYAKVSNVNVSGSHICSIIHKNEILYGKIVGGQLVQIYLQNGENEKATEIIRKTGAIFECGDESLNDIMKLFDSIPNCIIGFDGNTNGFSVIDQERKHGNIYEFSNCSINEETFSSKFHLCDLRFSKVNIISPDVLKDIFPSQIQRLSFADMTVNLPFDFTVEMVRLENVTVLEWPRTKWTVNKLILNNVNFVEKTEMKIAELIVYNASVDVTMFPTTVKKMVLKNVKVINCPQLPDSSLKLELQGQLEELNFTGVTFFNCNGRKMEKIDLTATLLPFTFKRLTLNSIQWSPPWVISFECFRHTQYIRLLNCDVIITPRQFISPKELHLNQVSFCRKYNEINQTDLTNKFVDLTKLKVLTLCEQNYSVDINSKGRHQYHEIFPFLYGKNSNSSLEKLTYKNVNRIDMEQTQRNVKELSFMGKGTTIDIFLLPQYRCLKKLELIKCVISNWSQRSVDKLELSSTLQNLTIDHVKFKDGSGNDLFSGNIIISTLIVPSIRKLKICTSAKIDLNKLVAISHLELKRCRLMKYSAVRLRPVELKLDNVKIFISYFYFWYRERTNILLDDIVDLTELRKLYLNSNNLCLDMSQNMCIKEVTLLNQDLDWKNVKWHIKELHLHYNPGSLPSVTHPVAPSVKHIYYYTSTDKKSESNEERRDVQHRTYIGESTL